MPDVAILDPQMTMSLPKKATASTGMDALCHAIESYSCIQKNPMSDSYAISAISLIRDNLFKVICKNEYANLLFFLADEETYIKTLKEERANKTIEIIKEWINKLNQMTGLPNKLQISDEDIEKVAKIAINDGAIIVNPKKANYEDIVEILKKARKN